MGHTQHAAPDTINAVPICQTCKSEHVARDAYACFNPASGLWELENVFDHEYCHACGQETKFDWVQVEYLHHQRVQALNDKFRIEGSGNGTIMLTPGIQSASQSFVVATIDAVRAFDDFSEDNDPWGEHDFGAIDIEDQKVFWKIDCYDPTMTQGSENPANEALTHRVLTIMLAREY